MSSAAAAASKFVISANITLSLDLAVKFKEPEAGGVKDDPIELTVGALLDIASDGTKKSLKASIGIDDTKKSESLRNFVQAATKLDLTRFGDVAQLEFEQFSDTAADRSCNSTTISIKAVKQGGVEDWSVDARLHEDAERALSLLQMTVRANGPPFVLTDLVECFSSEAAAQLKSTLNLAVCFTRVQFIRVKPKDTRRTATAVRILNGTRTLLEVIKTETLTHVRLSLGRLDKASNFDAAHPEKNPQDVDGFLECAFGGLGLRMNNADVFYSNSPGQTINFRDVLGKYQSDEDKKRFFDASELSFDLNAPKQKK